MRQRYYKRNVSAEGPVHFSNLKTSEPASYAAGVPGVLSTLKHSLKEMGVFRSISSLLRMNQTKGFDCPSCAWPDPEKPSRVGEYCENGAKALADEATRTSLKSDFFAEHSVEVLSNWSDIELNQLGRLVEPLVLKEHSLHYEPIRWEEAFEMIAEELGKLENPNEAVFYTSGRSSNEAAFLYGTFARALGTNNLPDCSNMCHESSGIALSETLGIGKGSVTLEDLYGAEVIIVAGQNPGTNHPRMLSALEKCKENGGNVISINPLAEAGLVHFRNPQRLKGWVGSGAAMADLHLPININQDIPLLKLIIKKLIQKEQEVGGILDKEFIESQTEGFELLLADLRNHSEAGLLELCGVEEEQVNKAVEILAGARKIIVCWAMGLTQHKNAVQTIREYVNLLLVKGAIGKPHSGTCPVRGHSNVQGDRSVGIMHYVDKAYNQRFEEHLGITPPDIPGLDVVGSIEAMYEGKVKCFMALGGNFLSAASDTLYTAKGLQNCELTVQVSTKLNRSHLITGKKALILPTYGRSEKDVKNGTSRYVTTENSMGRVRWSKGILKPASGNLMSEPEIIGSLGAAVFGSNHQVPWKSLGGDYQAIRGLIDKVARGFQDTETRAKGVGYYLPNNARDGDFSKLPNGRAKITVNPLPDHQLAEDEVMLMTIRSHDQFNTTIYGMNDRYRGVYGERRVIFMNEQDMQERGLRNLEAVDLSSSYDGVTRRADNFKVIAYQIPRRNAAAYFPETNVLVPYNHFADKSRTPISKSLRIRIHRKYAHQPHLY